VSTGVRVVRHAPHAGLAVSSRLCQPQHDRPWLPDRDVESTKPRPRRATLGPMREDSAS
jgi:hypothetical protein